jgi:hypothetical protein
MFRGSYYFIFLLIAVLSLGLLLGGETDDVKEDCQRLYSDRNKLTQVKEIRIDDGDLSVRLSNIAGQWLVQSRNNYPADKARVLALKRDLFEARLLEAKTQRPENHDLLGVGLNGIAISLDDEPYLVVGQSASGRSGRFVRFAGEDQVWLQSSQLTEVSANSANWLKRDLLDVDPETVRRIVIDHEGERLSVSQGVGVVSIAGIDASEYRYEGIQESLVNMFERVLLTDVAQRQAIDFSDASRVSVVTRQGGEGRTTSLALTKQDDQYWLAFVEGAPDSLSVNPDKWAFAISRLNYDTMTKQKRSLIKSGESS